MANLLNMSATCPPKISQELSLRHVSVQQPAIPLPMANLLNMSADVLSRQYFNKEEYDLSKT
jgi:hypothetical protein